MAEMKESKSLGELFGELARETSTLIRQEVQLAQAEMTHKAATFGKNMAFVVVAGCLAFVGFQALVAAAILALAQVMDAWLAALIVGGVLAAIAVVLLVKAIGAMKNEGAAPKQTIETIKEDVQWAKKQVG
jgi:hypothetical protein